MHFDRFAYEGRKDRCGLYWLCVEFRMLMSRTRIFVDLSLSNYRAWTHIRFT